MSPRHLPSPASLRIPGAGLLLSLAALTLPELALAQHPSPIPISNFASPERRIFDAKISPDGEWVAYTWVIQNAFNYETHLGVRRADGSSTSTNVLLIETGGTPWPPLPFTWRWNGQQTTLVYVDAPTFVNGYVQLLEINPASAPHAAVTRAFQQVWSVTQETWYLQQQPCGDVLAGVHWRYGVTSTTSNLWTVNLTGPSFTTVTHHPQTNTTLQPLPQDVSPDGIHVLYANYPGSAPLQNYDFHRVLGTLTPVLAGPQFGFVSMTGYLDDQTRYGRTQLPFSTPWAVTRDDVTGPTFVTNTAFTDSERAVAEPAHLGGSGTKRFFALSQRDVVPGSPMTVALMPTVYGGDITLFSTAGTQWAYAGSVTSDRASARVAFVTIDAWGDRQVFTVKTNRELEVTFVNPPATGIATFTATAPCGPAEACFLFFAQGLVSPPVPQLPPSDVFFSGFDLDPASTALLASGVGAPVSGQLQVAANPAFVGLPVYFQALRFDAVKPNVTRPARVRYF